MYSKDDKLLGDLLKELNINLNENILSTLVVNKVQLSLSKRWMSVELIGNNIVNYEILDKLKTALISKFNQLNEINVEIKYQIASNIESIIPNYWDNVKYLIIKELPSSIAWVDSLQWEVTSSSLKIFIGSEVAIHVLKKSDLDRLISQRISREFELQINVAFENKGNHIASEEEHYRIKEDEESSFVKYLGDITSTRKEKSISKTKVTSREQSSKLFYGNKIDGDITKISELNTSSGTATIIGEIFSIESKDIKGDKKLFTFNITDFTNSITVKVFANKKNQDVFEENLIEGLYVKLQGDVVYDSFSRQLVIMLKAMLLLDKPTREDNCKEKRVELHVHSKMSSMDGISSISSIISRASQWNHRAIAITDHGIVQGFPEAMEASKKYGIKVLYGVEGYVFNDSKAVVTNITNQTLNTEYVVFDIETTGLSPKNDKITEIGAVKIRNYEIIDTFSQLINPEIDIPEKIQGLTGISNEMVSNMPKIESVLPQFLEFIGGSVLVAHNATFDISFIKESCNNLDMELNNPVLDTLELTRRLFPQLKRHKLNIVAKHLNIKLENHHRAVDDSLATGEILLKCLNILEEKGFNKLEDINSMLDNQIKPQSQEIFHIIIFAQNYTGLKNLYKLISESHINHFYRKPRIPKSILTKYREGLILGTACEAGELYRALLQNQDENEVRNIVDYYDFLEIQPADNNLFLIDNGLVKDIQEIKNINIKITKLGEKFNKPVVATGDVHFLDPQDEVYRRILMSGQGFSDADNQAPLYFKTTDEMLKEFEYLGENKAKEVVISNPNLIADSIDELLPIPDGTFPPVIEGADEELREMNYRKAKSIYGEPLPDIVRDRLDREINSIIKNGYAVMYIIAQKLVAKSLSDGYLVGSRGSVGSSFVATMSDITEVNPLPPHYVCPNCKHSEFITDGTIGSGADLPDKKCPNCDSIFIKDGHDIPFEVFLGFEADKEPDIDLNFAGEYQSVAHQYTEDLFGKGYVFRAGTIGTIAEKTAYGFVKKYHEERGISISNAEINRLVKGCTGIKRTSGQHPGGVMIIPNYKDVLDFTPIQFPADDTESGVITTHFDYHSISGRILKLDILGHDVPTIIKMLEDITGINAQSIPLDDKDTIDIFTSTKSLSITKEDINSEVGTLGIPEFGTKFVRQMLIDTQPSTFAELVRISGLSHGTDVWINNAQELVRSGTAKLNSVISTRDDIMLYLIYNGLDKKRSFKIMEAVRKGKGLTEDDENYMKQNKIPNWYIESCKKIKYMFPKAHAVAYVMMSFRIAYFKVHHPAAFYATYFTTKASDFDAELIVSGIENVKRKIQELEDLGNDKSAKEKNLLTVLEVALEMYARGLNFKKIDLYKSHSDKFLISESGLLPPLKALQGVGENAARSIFDDRESGKYLSIEDLINRTKVSKTVVEALRNHGCLENLSESNQLSLFSI